MRKTVHQLNPSEQIDIYINSSEEFARPICKKLRKVILNSDPGMKEEWKWGPNYQNNGMVCGFGAFKNHVTLTFFKGSLLKDTDNILKDGGSNLHNRSVKFKSPSDINDEILSRYIKEAVKLNKAGIKPEAKDLEVPEILAEALNKNAKLKKVFEDLTYTERKEYIISVRDAKKEETRERRLEKIIADLISRKER